MRLNRLAYHTLFGRQAYRTSLRASSTIVGKSGRVYVQGEVLQRHHEYHKLSVVKAEYVSTLFSSYSSIISLTVLTKVRERLLCYKTRT